MNGIVSHCSRSLASSHLRLACLQPACSTHLEKEHRASIVSCCVTCRTTSKVYRFLVLNLCFGTVASCPARGTLHTPGFHRLSEWGILAFAESSRRSGEVSGFRINKFRLCPSKRGIFKMAMVQVVKVRKQSKAKQNEDTD